MDEYLVKEIIEALKIHLAEYLNTVWKTFAALIVSIGWLVSSETARSFISENSLIRNWALAVVFVSAIMHLSTLSDLYRKSAKAKEGLGNNVEGLLLSVVSTYAIPWYYPLFSFFLNGMLFLGLLALILFGSEQNV